MLLSAAASFFFLILFAKMFGKLVCTVMFRPLVTSPDCFDNKSGSLNL